MLPVFVYNVNEDHRELLFDLLSHCAKSSGTNFKIQQITVNANEANGWLGDKENQGTMLLIIGVNALSRNNDLTGLKLGRRAIRTNRDNYVVYVLEDNHDIEDVISVSSRVAGILCLPLREKRAVSIFASILNDYKSLLEQSKKQADSEQIVLKMGSSIHRVYQDQILYLRALDKKLEAVMLSQTFQFYANISQLSERLGDDFIRCHRSYLVNKGRIIEVDWADMMLTLTGGVKVPISRSCKAQLKKSIQESETE